MFVLGVGHAHVCLGSVDNTVVNLLDACLITLHHFFLNRVFTVSGADLFGQSEWLPSTGNAPVSASPAL